MDDTKYNVLFVLYVPNGQVMAGHLVSTIAIANSFVSKGHNVSIMVNSESPLLKRLNPAVEVFDDKCFNKYKGYYSRAKQIISIIRRKSVNLVISVDKHSTYHASLACAFAKTALLPIMPGGDPKLFKVPPLKLKKYILFSEESKSALIEKWNFNPDSIAVNDARFIFSDSFVNKRTLVNAKTDNIRLLYISGLRIEKLSAFQFFLNELGGCKVYDQLTVDIVGDGTDKNIFIEEVKRHNLQTTTTFLGFRDIDTELLQDYDLVITQGRGVIECSSMRMPVSICGKNGYKGLFTVAKLTSYATSNFTGRGIPETGNLGADIAAVVANEVDMQEISDLVRRRYSVSNLTNTIDVVYKENDLIPYQGKFHIAVKENLNLLLSQL